MPACPTCNGLGKVKGKIKCWDDCMDCDGKGWITENHRRFIEFYKNKKKIEKEIEMLEREEIRTTAETLMK